MKIIKKKIPDPSLINSSLDRINYEDSFAIELESELYIPLEKLLVEFFHSIPSWFHALFWLRNRIVSVFGLKTGSDKRSETENFMENYKGQPGESFSLFKTFGRTESELMVGEDDKHLDFRMSLFRTGSNGSTQIEVATVVRFNNWLGKAYFVPVKFFHRLIVPIMLKNMANSLSLNQKSYSAS
ncbi:MAG: DUF2867 domain-containing protein [Bacteroidia bacterium]|nr:DUF2867 domain-containing protein [Bacteroidia bacterium]